jgi:hypothetical protein
MKVGNGMFSAAKVTAGPWSTGVPAGGSTVVSPERGGAGPSTIEGEDGCTPLFPNTDTCGGASAGGFNGKVVISDDGGGAAVQPAQASDSAMMTTR